MLTLSGVSKSFAGRTLFADASLSLVRGDRIGLIGPNGAGKSTLFKLILGEESPDEGTLNVHRGVRVGHLPQESAPVGEETVIEIATAISPEFSSLRQRINELRRQIAHASSHPPPDDLGAAHFDGSHSIQNELHALLQEFDQAGGHQIMARARRILAGLSFRETDADRLAREMSGGWVMRAHLARLLVAEPDVLMLDEPTNHLDLEALLWVQNYLKTYPGAILLISHDREFLNQLCTHVLEIRQSRLFRYTGNYDSFLQQREANEQALLAAYKSQQREIQRLQEFADRFRAKNTKASQAQSKLKQIDRMEKIEAPVSTGPVVDFVFPQPRRSGHRVIVLKAVAFAYGQTSVYENLDFEAERGQRTVLVGPNGSGKSTLLKLLASVLQPDAGERTLGHNVKPGYYSQYRVEMLQPQRTVLEEALDTPSSITEQFARTVLGCFLFRGDDVFKKVQVLSGGEKSRLALVKLLLDPPNLLLMDEPTTHLDMPSIDALIQAMKQFAGTILFISHDVHFIRSIATHVVHVREGCLTHYPGGYQYYLDKTAQQDRAGLTSALPGGGDARRIITPAARNSAAASLPASRKDQKRLEAEARQQVSNARKEARRRVDALEQVIADLEERQAELTAELEKPETYASGGQAVAINRELLEIQDQLPSKLAAWEEATLELDQHP